MQVTLINPPGLKVFAGLQMQTPNPNLGLAYISAAIREAGFDCTAIDGVGEALDQITPYSGYGESIMIQGLSLQQIVDKIPADSDVIGLSCMFSNLWPLTNDLANLVRERFPDATMILGGEHGTAVPEHTLQSSTVDIVVLGEGEETIVSLLQCLEQDGDLAEVKGIAFRRDGEVVNNGLSPRQRSIDEIAPPDWDSWPLENYIDRGQINGVNLGRSIPLIGTRGCPYACTFCSNPGMWTRRWIPRDPKHLVDEMQSYIERYQVRNFDFQDLTFVVNKRWTIEFCREIIDRNLDITFQMPSGTRAEAFDEEVVDHLYRAGCRVIAFAPESGDDEVRRAVKKQVDLDKLKAAVRASVARGLKVSCFFVIGFPQDTTESLKSTLRLVRTMAMLGAHDVSVAQFTPYPGSDIFRDLQKSGRIALDDEFFISPLNFYTSDANSFSDHVDSKELYRAMITMFCTFYLLSFARRPLRTAIILFKALFTGVEETRFAKWFRDRLVIRRRWQNNLRSADSSV